MKKIIAILLTGILLLSLCACGKKAVQEQTEETVAESRITALQYSDGNTLVRFTYVEDAWKWTDGLDFPLDAAFVTELVENVKTLFQLESVGKMDDAASYGLDNVSKYVIVSDDRGSDVTFSFGKQNADGQWYMSREDQQDTVYLVDNDFVEKLSAKIYDMALLPTLPQFTAENLYSVKMEQADSLQVSFLYKDGKWISGGKTLSTDGLLEELEKLAVVKCVDYQPSEGAVSLCGLDTPLTVTINYTNSVDARTDWVLKVGTPVIDGEGYYVICGDDSTIYQMTADSISTILTLANQNRVVVADETAEEAD